MRVLSAVLRESLDEVREALRAGAPVDERDRTGRTPLIHASIDGLGEITKQLLAGSAEPNAADDLGMTPLHYAVQGRHVDVVRMLLAEGSDPNTGDTGGNTPTHRAVFGLDGSAEARTTLRLLLTEGADLSLRNHAGVSAAALARDRGIDLESIRRSS